MPAWIAKVAAKSVWKRIPWRMVWVVSLWLVEKGRERMQRNLTDKERKELVNLVLKSKGRPSSLPQRDRTRVKNIAGKAIRG
ncbi:MAG TPA: hypothetical protein VIT85_07750 [Solirubrobacterales bacterium]